MRSQAPKLSALTSPAAAARVCSVWHATFITKLFYGPPNVPYTAVRKAVEVSAGDNLSLMCCAFGESVWRG
jgi:hypothetical protein